MREHVTETYRLGRSYGIVLGKRYLTTLCAVPSHDHPWKKPLEDAKMLVKTGKAKESVEKLESWVHPGTKLPRQPMCNALSLLGHAYGMQGEIEKSIRTWKRWYQVKRKSGQWNETNGMLYWKLGKKFMKYGEAREATRVLLAALRCGVNTFAFYKDLGLAQGECGDRKYACISLQRALLRAENQPTEDKYQVITALATYQEACGKAGVAKETLVKGIRWKKWNESQREGLTWKLGVLLFRLRDKRCVKVLHSVLRSRRKNLDGYAAHVSLEEILTLVGEAEVEFGVESNGIQKLEEAIEVGTRHATLNVRPLLRLTRVLEQQHDFGKGVQVVQDALRTRVLTPPLRVHLHIRLGDLLRKQRKWNAAMEHYEQALDLRRTIAARMEKDVFQSRILERMGQIRMRQNYAEALPLLEKAVQIRSKAQSAPDFRFALLLHDLALLQFKTRQLTAARKTIRQAMALGWHVRKSDVEHPIFGRMVYLFARILAEEGYQDDSMELFDAALKLVNRVNRHSSCVLPLQGNIYREAGNAFVQMGHLNKGLDAYERALVLKKKHQSQRGNPDISWTMSLLGSAILRSNAPDAHERGLKMLKKAVHVVESAKRPSSFTRWAAGFAWRNLAEEQLRLGMQKDGTRSLESALRSFVRAAGLPVFHAQMMNRVDDDMANTATALVLHYERMGEKEKSARVLRWVGSLQEKYAQARAQKRG